MERLSVAIAPDGLQAELLVAPGPAVTPAVTIDELRQALAAAGCVHGIDDDALATLAVRSRDQTNRIGMVVARGTLPICGTDGYLSGAMLDGPIAGTTNTHGDIDYRERIALHPAATGQALAEIVAPSAGTPGRAVDGRELASTPGQSHAERPGPGVRRDGNTLISDRDGVLLVTEQDIDVVPLYTHAGDVDYTSGNLHSHGSLVIQGDVRDGFTATAHGDIVVNGSVQGGGLTAGGAALVGLGILGRENVVRAGTDIRCHHATAAKLVADRSIDVGDQVMQSELQAPSIRVAEGRGVVRGGELRARDSIEVRSAGAPSGTPTTLAVGDLLGERVELARRTIAASRLDRNASREAGRTSKGLRAAVRAGDSERREQLRLQKRRDEVLRSARILILGNCHAGVALKFAGAELLLTEAVGPAVYSYDCKKCAIVRGELPCTVT